MIDTSAIVQIKIDVAASRQWEVLKRLEELIESGTLCFPREVAREAKNVSHPDAPGVWVHGVEAKIAHVIDPSDESMRYVMSVAGAVVDPDSSVNGDAQVLAMAHELLGAGHHPTIVSEDFIDREVKMSIESASVIVGVAHMRLDDYLQLVASDLL